METILKFENVSFAYQDGGRKLQVLKDANVSFEKGVFYSIIGPSGSGKTTAIALAGALDVPQKGRVLYMDKDIKNIGLTKYRRKHISLIFQSYNLINYMTALENIVMAMDISGSHKGNRKAHALQLLADLGLDPDEHANRNVLKLSGGEQQRVAIARALASEADIILADEPTGNLDPETAQSIVDILKKLATDYGKCVIAVTHSLEVAKISDVVYRFEKGTLVKQVKQ
jgi:putative ABC transport system ATP-binding protein